jgi:hypothetical protein
MEGWTACAAEQMRILSIPKAIVQVILVSLKALMDLKLSSQIRERRYLTDVAVEFKKDRGVPNWANRRTDHLWSVMSLKVAISAIPAVLGIPEVRIIDLNGAQMIQTLVA